MDGKEGANPGLCRVVEQTRLHGVEIKERKERYSQVFSWQLSMFQEMDLIIFI